MATYAAGMSGHPLATQAVGEAVGQVLEQLDGPPDLCVLTATAHHTGPLDDIVRAVRRLINPRALIGCTAMGVLGGSQEIESQPGLALWTARWGLDTPAVRLDAVQTADGALVVAGGASLASNEGTLVLLSDPFSFPADRVLDHLADAAPGVAVIGGMASAAVGPGGNRLVVDDEIFTDGAVGVHIPASAPVRTIVSQGCRPIGEPMTVTAAERNILYELAGQPALDRVEEIISRLTPEERQASAGGLHVGRVINEHRETFGPGDFLVRGVLGADRDRRAVAIGDEVEVGATVQFQIRDAATADDDLRAMTDGLSGAAALVFTCNGRGADLFGEAHHDAAIVSEAIGGGPLAGAFCAGELGPIGGRSFIHGFTASIAVFE